MMDLYKNGYFKNIKFSILYICSLIFIFFIVSTNTIYAASTGVNSGLGWSCTAGGTKCKCEGGKESEDCKDMVDPDISGVCVPTPIPSDGLTCDIHDTCSCTATKTISTTIKPILNAGNLLVIENEEQPAVTSKAFTAGGNSLGWSCTSGSEFCNCTGGMDSDDCDALRNKMCGGREFEDSDCDPVTKICTCNRGKKAESKTRTIIKNNNSATSNTSKSFILAPSRTSTNSGKPATIKKLQTERNRTPTPVKKFNRNDLKSISKPKAKTKSKKMPTAQKKSLSSPTTERKISSPKSKRGEEISSTKKLKLYKGPIEKEEHPLGGEPEPER